jgi:amidase
LKYAQAQLDNSDEMDLQADRRRYEADREKDVTLAGRDGIDATLKENRLDAIVFPGSSGAAIGAKPGYPTVIVPFGMVLNNVVAAGFDPKPSPYGVSFTGTACSEGRLIELAYAFEQATRRRVPPSLD